MEIEPTHPATQGSADNRPAPRYPQLIPSIQRGEYYTSFAHIAQTAENTVTFDKNASDPVAKEYNEVLGTLLKNVASDTALHQLNSPAQQEAYEQALAQHVYDATKGTKFDVANYRQARTGGSETRSLNALTDKDEFDCEHLTLIRGLLMHEADQTLVALENRNEPTQLYAAAGGTMRYSGETPRPLGGHQFIVSTNTGNIIEATDRSDGYKKTNVDFSELIAGYPAITDNEIYSPTAGDTYQALAEKRLRVIQSDPSDVAALNNLTQPRTIGNIPLSDRSKQVLDDLIPVIERVSAGHCTKPMQVESGTSIPIMTLAGPLQTQDHLDTKCLDHAKRLLVDSYKTSISTRELAENFVSSSAKNLPSLPVSTTEEVTSPLQTPSAPDLPHPSLRR
jgi:hypothetical protein